MNVLCSAKLLVTQWITTSQQELPATGHYDHALPIVCRWIYIGPMITLYALPAAIVGHRPWAVLWLATMCFLVSQLGCSHS